MASKWEWWRNCRIRGIFVAIQDISYLNGVLLHIFAHYQMALWPRHVARNPFEAHINKTNMQHFSCSNMSVLIHMDVISYFSQYYRAVVFICIYMWRKGYALDIVKKTITSEQSTIFMVFPQTTSHRCPQKSHVNNFLQDCSKTCTIKHAVLWEYIALFFQPGAITICFCWLSWY